MKTATLPATVAAAFAIPELAKGEIYAGVLLKDGKPSHHLVLLPGDEKKNWKDAVAWAAEKGGELPTRKEQALLFANAGDAFKDDWYWSSETHARYGDCAWDQGFGHGYQGNDHKGGEYRCRAVRRVPI